MSERLNIFKDFIRTQIQLESDKAYRRGQGDANKFQNNSECECVYEKCSELRHCGNTKCGFTI